ncbi:hypothetical protein BVRB_3g057250 [Beta vulgaris subsp. vulgaris]|nr:hypothetical protein BVRB_3g057250 [Beta vulgaris subsp. vulgaris]
MQIVKSLLSSEVSTWSFSGVLHCKRQIPAHLPLLP